MDDSIENRHREIILDILRREVPDAEVYLFGSRATGTARPTSDADIALRAGTPLSTVQTARLAVAFSDSNLPFFVDIVDLRTIDEEFRREIEEHSKRLA